MNLPIRGDISLTDLKVNQRELGKVLLIASTVLLVVSLHAFYSFSDIESSVNNLDQEADETIALLNSETFNNSLQALRDVNALDVNRKVGTIVQGMNSVRSTLQESQGVVQSAESSKETYQWLSLFSILGIISGAVLFLMER